jgi:hypothetical protein
MKDYSIVTVANRKPIEPYYTFDEFFKSLPNENIFVLGTHPGEYVGLGSKPKLLYNAIKGGMLDTKYIIFCDCFDLVFATSPEHLILKHKQFAAPMVISAEKNCFPDKLKEQYDAQHKGESPYKYLNSGMIVGHACGIRSYGCAQYTRRLLGCRKTMQHTLQRPRDVPRDILEATRKNYIGHRTNIMQYTA